MKYEYDSRKISSGDVFICIKGENNDPYDYVDDVIKKGASLIIGDDKEKLSKIKGIKTVYVKDSVKEFGLITKKHLEVISKNKRIKIIGITASVGKTTIKNLIGYVLKKYGNTVYPQESFNNEIGVPYTILHADKNTDFLVLEIGASKVGDISYLTNIIGTIDTAVIGTIGIAHLGEFKSFENIVKTKSEILSSSKHAFIDKNSFTKIIENTDLTSTIKTTPITIYGVLDGSTKEYISNTKQKYENLFSSKNTRLINFLFENTNFVKTKLLGEHNISNCIACVGVCQKLQIPKDEIIKCLDGFTQTTHGRMEKIVTKNGAIIINDSFNANPISMNAGLEAFEGLSGKNIANHIILGSMLELGEQSERLHEELALKVMNLNLKSIILVGKETKVMFNTIKNSNKNTHWFLSVEKIDKNIIQSMNSKDNMIFIKGSHGVNLQELIKEF